MAWRWIQRNYLERVLLPKQRHGDTTQLLACFSNTVMDVNFKHGRLDCKHGLKTSISETQPNAEGEGWDDLREGLAMMSALFWPNGSCPSGVSGSTLNALITLIGF